MGSDGESPWRNGLGLFEVALINPGLSWQTINSSERREKAGEEEQ
jgi:hypothetical protein